MTNSGISPATFSSGDTILTDNLPNVNISYGTVTVTPISGITGTDRGDILYQSDREYNSAALPQK